MNVIKPILSEKTLKLVETDNKYTFLVDRYANKSKIKEVIESMFDVHVCQVATRVKRAKAKRAGKKRQLTKGADLKEAVVRLDKKDKISLFDIKERKK